MLHIPDIVHTLERELRGIFGSRLQSLVVYGLRTHAVGSGEHDGPNHAHGAALTHTLAVVDGLTAEDLRACTGRVAGWHDARVHRTRERALAGRGGHFR